MTPLMAGDFFDCSKPLLMVGFCTSVVTKGGIKPLVKKSRRPVKSQGEDPQNAVVEAMQAGEGLTC